MIKKFLFFCLIFKLSASFQDAEFDLVCSLIGNINCPCFEEYRLIENYLNNGDRSYLDVLRRSDQVETYQGRLKCISNFRLVSPGDQPPLFEHRIVNEGRTNRCILLYASSNGIYPDKARKLLREIENSGYSGHLLLRIGGFPNVANGGLKICDVPYAFKVAFLQEAKLLGFKKILWIDLAIHPLDGFEALF